MTEAIDMNAGERDLRRLALFIVRFFQAVSVVVASLPIIDKLVGLLPVVVRDQNVTTVLTSFLTIVLVAWNFLNQSKRKSFQPSMGIGMLIVGTALTIIYVGFADSILAQGRTVGRFEEFAAIGVYVLIFLALTQGFWEMALLAYRTRKIPIRNRDLIESLILRENGTVLGTLAYEDIEVATFHYRFAAAPPFDEYANLFSEGVDFLLQSQLEGKGHERLGLILQSAYDQSYILEAGKRSSSSTRAIRLRIDGANATIKDL
jgi:hypothetical protein